MAFKYSCQSCSVCFTKQPGTRVRSRSSSCVTVKRAAKLVTDIARRTYGQCGNYLFELDILYSSAYSH